MKTYVTINSQKIEATVYGRSRDTDWDDRDSKSIQLTMSYAEALNLFKDNTPWQIIGEFEPYQDEQGHMITPEPEVYDNSEYCIAGPITDNRDGTVVVKMGKLTEAEVLQKQINQRLKGAITTAELDRAYQEGVNSL